MKQSFIICALLATLTVCAFGKVETIGGNTFTLASTSEAIFSESQTSFSFLFTSDSFAYKPYRTEESFSCPGKLYCPVHKVQMYFGTQEGWGDTCACVFSHDYYENRQRYVHKLYTSCSK